MNDLSFVDRLPVRTEPRLRQDHVNDLRREFFKHKLKGIANYAEQAQDYCRDLINAGADVSEELKELETTARGLLLVGALLAKAANDKRDDATRIAAE